MTTSNDQAAALCVGFTRPRICAQRAPTKEPLVVAEHLYQALRYAEVPHLDLQADPAAEDFERSVDAFHRRVKGRNVGWFVCAGHAVLRGDELWLERSDGSLAPLTALAPKLAAARKVSAVALDLTLPAPQRAAAAERLSAAFRDAALLFHLRDVDMSQPIPIDDPGERYGQRTSLAPLGRRADLDGVSTSELGRWLGGAIAGRCFNDLRSPLNIAAGWISDAEDELYTRLPDQTPLTPIGSDGDERKNFDDFERVELGRWCVSQHQHDKAIRLWAAWVKLSLDQGRSDSKTSMSGDSDLACCRNLIETHMLGLWRDSPTKREDCAIVHELLLLAAGEGEASACFCLGLSYGYGLNAPPSDDLAFPWMKRAVELGSKSALAHLGYAYAKGEGTDVDEARAASLIAQSILEGCGVGGRCVQRDRPDYLGDAMQLRIWEALSAAEAAPEISGAFSPERLEAFAASRAGVIEDFRYSRFFASYWAVSYGGTTLSDDIERRGEAAYPD